MNANLMRSSCFQPTLDQGVLTQRFDRPHVGDGPLSLTHDLVIRATAPPIPPVTHQNGIDRHRFDWSRDDGLVAPHDRMLRELSDQESLGFDRAGEYHQAAGVAIQSMDGSHAGWSPWASGARTFAFGDDPVEAFFQGRLSLPPFGRPETFLRMAQGRHSGRFVNDHDVLVDKANFDAVLLRGQGQRMGKYMQHFADRQSATGVEAQVAVDLNLALFDESPSLPPRLVEALMQGSDERLCCQRPVDLNDARLIGSTGRLFGKTLSQPCWSL